MVDLAVAEVESSNSIVGLLFPESSQDGGSLSSDSQRSHGGKSEGTNNNAANNKSSSGRSGNPKSSDYFNMNLSIAKDVEKLFSKKLTTFLVKPPNFNQPAIISGVIQIALKTSLECIRLRTFGTNGFNQIQVDIYYLRSKWRALVDDESYLQMLLDENAKSSAERCLDPKPLDQNVSDRYFIKKKNFFFQSRSGLKIIHK